MLLAGHNRKLGIFCAPIRGMWIKVIGNLEPLQKDGLHRRR